jgi:two-component system nitrogen regulation response regulator GlnG
VRDAPPRVLITDDESDFRWVLVTLLRHAGFLPLEAESGPRALEIVQREPIDAMLLDLRMPEWDGLRTLRAIRQAGLALPIIMLTGFGSIPTVVEAMRSGANGYLTKPFDNDDLLQALSDALAGRVGPPRWSGESDASQRTAEAIHRVAPTDFTVLLVGETGTGKEVAARELHRQSRRAHGPFVPIDCGAIPADLLENELFGHERGAFTSADRSHAGCFEAATGGTLFLDEIGNLPLAMQAKLLRVLQERQIRRVGSNQPVSLDLRIIAATNGDLTHLIETGEFRRDLFHRLDEFRIALPPLRERGDDLLPLADRFRLEAAVELGRAAPAWADGAITAMHSYAWPGNIRELRNAVRRAVLLADGVITPALLRLPLPALKVVEPPPETATRPPIRLDGRVTFKDLVREQTAMAERELLTRALRQSGGNKARAARLLHLDYKTVRTKLKDYGLA